MQVYLSIGNTGCCRCHIQIKVHCLCLRLGQTQDRCYSMDQTLGRASWRVQVNCECQRPLELLGSVTGYCRLKAGVTGWGRSPASVIYTAEVSQACAGAEQMSQLLATVLWCHRHRAGITDCYRYRADVRSAQVQDRAAGYCRDRAGISIQKRYGAAVTGCCSYRSGITGWHRFRARVTSWYRHTAGVTG